MVGCLVFVLVMFKGDVVAGIFSTDASVSKMPLTI